MNGRRLLSTTNVSHPTDAYPQHVDRRTAAAIVTQRFFPVSHRSLERWPLPVRVVNNKAVIPTADLLAEAQARFDAAPMVMHGAKTAA